MAVISHFLFLCLFSWRIVRLSLVNENYRSSFDKKSEIHGKIGHEFIQNSVRKFEQTPGFIKLSSNPPFTFNITVGDPPQTFRILLDIGGTSFFIPSTRYQHGNNNISRYNHSASKTYEEDGEEFRDYVWDVKGFFSTDQVCLEGICFNQTFIEADTMRLYKYAGIVDGVMGLDLRRRTEYSILSLINSLYFNFLIPKQIISIWNNLDKNSAQKAEIIFGGVDPTLFSEPITWFPINNYGIQMEKIIIDGLEYSTLDKETLIQPGADIYGPPKIFLEINKKIIGANCTKKPCYNITCENIAMLPDISFVLSGKKFVLNPTDYINQRQEKCFSRLIPFAGRYVILGDPFINKYYTAFDVRNSLVGFAENKQNITF